jgi:hypothetical protein
VEGVEERERLQYFFVAGVQRIVKAICAEVGSHFIDISAILFKVCGIRSKSMTNHGVGRPKHFAYLD